MPDPVTEPAADSDPKTLRILRGLPKGVFSVEIVYKASSRLPGGRTARRSAAEYAVLKFDTTEGYREDKVDLTAAEKYLDDALRVAKDADDKVRRTAEAVDVTCPYCGRARHYKGLQSIITAEPGMIAGLREMTVEALKLHLYLCRSCGSTALFADGYLEHPLPGSTK